ncbi:hypothetical protein COV19_06010 [Candidatus Woesearchaeota archaeon CG10_big_fil_rev_8_21_14_0_10_44_13]|nr:MAG: hypothetical protein COV19_06010 [Candidatus Woesearchaeota archaeon CG10_big_fil_rev_8_21_14_0_10_44_13]
MKMASEEILYQKIENPVEFRRNLLESSKQVIRSLQKYERLKAVRLKKAEQISKLRNIVREISILNSKLKKEFPDLIFKAQKAAKPQEKRSEKKKAEKKEEQLDRKETRELVDLEKQLKDIEKKLETIS